jgi:D-alanyl-D-alanine carboxypeptidase
VIDCGKRGTLAPHSGWAHSAEMNTPRSVSRTVRLAVLALVLAPSRSTQGQEIDRLRDRLQARLDSLVEPEAVPGMSLGVALPDGTSLGLVAGWADTARHVPLSPDMLMLQGSVGKTYFGAVALQLVAEGAIDLDARMASYLEGEPWIHRLPNGGDVTVRQLLSHTSGIVRYELHPDFLRDLTADPMRTFGPEERLAYLFDSGAPFEAGEGWDYADTNYILVALLIERLTGNRAYDEIRRRVLEPLELRHTVPSDRPRIPGLAQGYAGPRNPFGGFDEMVADGALVLNPQFEWGGGGFASTAEDLARWIRDVQEGRAFDPELLDEYRSGVPAPLGPEARYGLGVILMRLAAGRAWGHSGFMPGYRTEAYFFPDHGFALALQVNTSSQAAFPPSPLRMLGDIAALVVEELGPQGQRGE